MIAPIEAEQLAAAKDALVRFDADKVKRQGSSGRSYSAVLFGPPGTAKTTICEAVAKKLGWSFLVVDTSAFLADGEPTARESITILQSTPLKSSHFSHLRGPLGQSKACALPRFHKECVCALFLSFLFLPCLHGRCMVGVPC